MAAAALAAALAATALAAVAPADAASGRSTTAPRATSTGCQGKAFLYGIRADATLTFTAVNAGTNEQTRKFAGPKLPFTPRAMATLDQDTILATSTTGALYRIDVTDNATRLAATTTRLASSGWTHDKLAADGVGHLFGTIGSNNMLMRYDVAGSRPTAASITRPTRIGAIYTLTSMTATGGGQLVGTTESGKLLGYKAIGEGRFEARTLLTSGFTGVDRVTSAGSGVFYARTAAGGALTTRRDANVGDQSGADISTVGVVASSGWTQKLLSAAPKTVTCGGSSASITYDDLVAMFGSGWVGDRAVVEAGLPSLEAEMRKGAITTPRAQGGLPRDPGQRVCGPVRRGPGGVLQLPGARLHPADQRLQLPGGRQLLRHRPARPAGSGAGADMERPDRPLVLDRRSHHHEHLRRQPRHERCQSQHRVRVELRRGDAQV